MNRLAQPGNGLAQVSHVARGLLIVRNFTFLPAKAEIPVCRTRDNGSGHQEHMVHRVEGMSSRYGGVFHAIYYMRPESRFRSSGSTYAIS
jgi:hypothetical protein